jgi:iron complex outermembrane receptor protein
VRWNYERKHFNFEVEQFGNPATTRPSENWSVPTGQLILTWHASDRVNLYTRYTRGWKAGHFNSIATERLETVLADPETNDAWEAGARGAAWDGRLSASGAFYYYHYTDYQVFLFTANPQVPPTLSIVNAHEAELYGTEVEVRARPFQGLVHPLLDGLELSANASWAQGKYIDFQNEQSFRSGGGFTTVTFDYSGNDLANAPRYKFSGTVEWTFDLGRFGALIPRYDLSWTDDQFFDPTQGRGDVTRTSTQTLPKLTVAQPALWLHHLRLTYRTPSQNVEIAGWVRNLTDEVYKTYAFDASRFAGEVLNFVGEPRTVGADLTITF